MRSTKTSANATTVSPQVWDESVMEGVPDWMRPYVAMHLAAVPVESARVVYR